MIRKIKSSLFAEVFLITLTMLLVVSIFIYAVLAVLLPKTYSAELEQALDRQARDLAGELSRISMEESGSLFDRFLRNETIAYLELYTEQGIQLEIPSGSAESTGTASEAVTVEAEAVTEMSYEEQAPLLSESYWFSFQGSGERCMLTVYGRAREAAKLQKSFSGIFPIFLGVMFLAAFGVSFLYSRLITNPIVKLSHISKEISSLKLEWKLAGDRQDELGVLEKSLNEMSVKLAETLKELREANRQLALDMEREKALEQARLDFFSAVSHELKTPITIIKGQLEGMCLKIGVYRDRDKYLARALEVTNRLEAMVGEILTALRLETAREDFQNQCFDCVPLIMAYLEEAEDLTAQKQLRVHTHYEGKACMNGNKPLMEKVFSNLIGNAVKYSPREALVTICIRFIPKGWVFSVENTGVSIPAQKLTEVFDAFTCVDPSRNRESAGNGLGLYLVQRILERHGSVCRVCNTDQGVRFWFEMRISGDIS